MDYAEHILGQINYFEESTIKIIEFSILLLLAAAEPLHLLLRIACVCVVSIVRIANIQTLSYVVFLEVALWG